MECRACEFFLLGLVVGSLGKVVYDYYFPIIKCQIVKVKEKNNDRNES